MNEIIAVIVTWCRTKSGGCFFLSWNDEALPDCNLPTWFHGDPLTVGETDRLSMLNGLLSAIRILFLLFMPTHGGQVGGEVGARMEVKRLVKLCRNREQGLALSKLRKVARNMVKRCADAAMMNTIIAIIELPGLIGNLRTIWHTICARRLTCTLNNFFFILYNDVPSTQGGNSVTQFT